MVFEKCLGSAETWWETGDRRRARRQSGAGVARGRWGAAREVHCHAEDALDELWAAGAVPTARGLSLVLAEGLRLQE